MQASFFPYLLIIEWFLKNRRDFPWRKTTDPYHIWVSEVMLQQTRAQVVVSYYQKWLEKFPTVISLASSSHEEVIKEWEGLGYYSRARNLHKGAKKVLEDFHGSLPANKKDLQTIPGIGSYTAGAILNFAFCKKAAAVDANVIRVLLRFFAIEKIVAKEINIQEIEEMALSILPNKDFQYVSEALIELGAMVCKKKPLCNMCPLRCSCRANLENKHYLPNTLKGKKIEYIDRVVFVLEHCGHFLLRKKKVGVHKDLYQFPYTDEIEVFLDKNQISLWGERNFPFSCHLEKILPKVKQTYTKYSVTLYPYYFSVKKMKKYLDYEWVSLYDLAHVPFCSGHRKILRNILA